MARLKLINTLNIEQKQATLSKFRNTLVVASAGTGKTSTIMARIEHLLSKGVEPREIMLITFTNKAANEMLERLEKYFKHSVVQGIMAGTFHAIALKHISASVKGMKLIQKFEALALLKNSASKVGLLTVSDENRFSNNQLLYLFNGFQSSRIESLGEYLSLETAESDKKEHNYDSYVDLYYDFQSTKRRANLFEFNDLLIYAKEFTQQIGLNSYNHLIVDEYQDTNPLQEALVDGIVPQSLFCVGDYDQSIYGFNGADISIITNFLDKYDDSGYYNLKRNYRSAPKILDLAEKVIRVNERIYPKELIAEYKGETGDEEPKYFKFENNSRQFEAIASYILTIDESKRDDVAILFRGNTSANGAEIALNELNIPYERKSGTSFFDRDDVQIILACLMIATGDFKYEELAKAYYDIHISHTQLETVYKAILNSGFSGGLTGGIPLTQEDRKSVFFDELILFRKQCKSLKKPTALIEKTFKSDLFAKLIDLQAFRGGGSIAEDEKRLNDKKNILLSAADRHKTIDRFIKSLEKKGNKDDDGVAKVKLMSVHASKGLEFNAIFVVDLIEKMFPNQRLMSSGGTLEEERRLFYVAVTRAKNILWLCYPTRDRKGNKNKPSIFLKEAGYEKS